MSNFIMEPIEVKKEKIPQEEYFITLNVMFGDADGYKTTKSHINEEDIKPVFKFLTYMDSLSWNAEIRWRENIDEDGFYKIVGEEYKERYLWDYMLDIWERDYLYDMRAKIMSWVITYFDFYSQEHKIIGIDEEE